MSDRLSFLQRVGKAAEQGRQYRVHAQPVPDEIGYLGAGDDLVERMAAEVAAVGGQAYLVPDDEVARATLLQLLAEANASSALCWQHELLTRLNVADLLRSQGVKHLDYQSLESVPLLDQRQTLLACDVGITSCDCAIAETGTLMMCSRPGQERLASLLPPLHIAIVERSQIVPDLIDAFGRLSGRGLEALPTNVTFITGPSKTGDIELQLTTGVHGPGKWCVIIIGDGSTQGSAPS